MKSVVYSCYTYFHLLTTLSLIDDNVDEKRTLILSNEIPNAPDIKKRIKKYQLFEKIEIIDNDYPTSYVKEMGFFKKIRFVFRFKKLMRSLFDYNTNHDLFVTFHSGTLLSKHLFYLVKEVHLYEDGIASPEFLKRKLFQKSLERLHILPSVYSKKYTKIFTSYDYLQGKIANKKMYFDSRKSIFKMSKAKITMLTDVFNFDLKNVNLNDSIVILTQPLFIDDYFKTEKEQLDLYKRIFDDCNLLSENVYIKPHPRDNTDYKNITRNILNKNMPFELYNLLGIHFDKYATYFSTAVNGIDKNKVISFKEKF